MDNSYLKKVSQALEKKPNNVSYIKRHYQIMVFAFVVVSVVVVSVLVLGFSNCLLTSGLNFILHQIMYLERLLIPFPFFYCPNKTSSGNKNIFLSKKANLTS